MEPTRPTLAFLPVHLYTTLLDVLAEHGHARGAVLAAAHVGAESFARSGGYISLQQAETLVRHACMLVPARDLGLEVGARTSLMGQGSLGVAALSAATVGEALAVLAEHFALVSPLLEPSVREQDGFVVIELGRRWSLADEVDRFHAGFCAGVFAHVLRLLPSSGSLPLAAGMDVADRELRIPAALAELRLPLADVRVHHEARGRCRARLESRPDPTETAATVRRVLLASGAPFPGLDAIAKRLATSSRSLRRRLHEEGTSFRVLLDEVRSRLADAWLEDPRRSITEIGLDLGYTDPANFARAYRRANGRSPSAARRRRLGLGVAASA